MAENIGPKIGIEGYADFSRSMSNIIAKSKELASEFKLVTSQFDKNDQSQEKLAAQMRVLGQQISLQEKRVEMLAAAYSDSEKKTQDLQAAVAKAAKEFGENSKQVKKAQGDLDRHEKSLSNAKRAYNEARTTLNTMNGELNDLKSRAANASSEVDKLADDIKDAAKEADGLDFGDVLGAGFIVEGAKSALDAIGGVIDEAAEYRKIMASLDVSSEAAGYTTEQTAKSFRQLYGVLGDDQTAATATANLQAIGLSQGELERITNATIGAWAKYGDSIPIDGLAEAVNETIKTGTVTGAFADVLNWAGQSEDDFNKKLESANGETERANLVLQAMAQQGLVQAGEAWQENNEDIIAANNAQLSFRDNAALLSEQLSPVLTAVQNGFNDIFAAILQTTEGIDFNAIAAQVQGFFDVAADGITFVIENKDLFIAALAGIAGGFAALKLASLANDIKGVIAGTKLLSETFPLLGNAIGLLTNPVFLVSAAVIGLVTLIATKGDEIQAILQKVDDFLQNVFATDWTEIFGPVIGDVLNGFMANVKNIWDAIKRIFDGVIDFIRGVFTGDWERAWKGVQNIFGGLFDGLVALAKAPLNGIIGLLNGAIGAVNALIEGFNSIGFDMPSWLGGGSWHPSIPSIPRIPYLAKGGIVMRGSAIVGEAGPELMTVLGDRTIVQPLPSSFSKPVAKTGGGGLATVNITVNAAPGMDENALADAVAYKIQSMAQRKAAVW